MNDIQQLLKKNREGLSDNSIKTYTSNIKSLYKKMNPDKPLNGSSILDFFKKHPKDVMTFFKDVPANKRKTTLASLVVLCHTHSSSDVYRNQMIKDTQSYNNELKNQTKTDSQKKSWITQDNVLKIYRKLYRSYAPLFNKDNLDMNELQDLQKLVILSLYVLIPPRRLLDYTAFKLKNVGETDNYMDGKSFIFNTYKTAKKYKQQSVSIPLRLKNIIAKWATKHDNDSLLFDTNNKPLSPPKLTLTLNHIFGGKKISVNQLRHTFITDEVLPDIPALTKLENTAKDMGHSVETQLLYKKN